MMDELIRKAEGRLPFPLVQADATRIPLSDAAFGAAYLRWVLHLIADWRIVLAEMVRVVRPGGVILTSLGAYGGARAEIQERFAQLAGISLDTPGLTWAGYDQLDGAMTALGARMRELPPFTDVERYGLEAFVDGIARSAYSWTWRVADPAVLARVAGDVREWAEERYGPLDEYPALTFEVVWRAYDLPS